MYAILSYPDPFYMPLTSNILFMFYSSICELLVGLIERQKRFAQPKPYQFGYKKDHIDRNALPTSQFECGALFLRRGPEILRIARVSTCRVYLHGHRTITCISSL